MPALYAMLATVLVVVAIVTPAMLNSALREAAASALYVSNVTQFGADTSTFNQFFLHTWTLSFEIADCCLRPPVHAVVRPSSGSR